MFWIFGFGASASREEIEDIPERPEVYLVQQGGPVVVAEGTSFDDIPKYHRFRTWPLAKS